jgi:hypothetical protein
MPRAESTYAGWHDALSKLDLDEEQIEDFISLTEHFQNHQGKAAVQASTSLVVGLATTRAAIAAEVTPT